MSKSRATRSLSAPPPSIGAGISDTTAGFASVREPDTLRNLAWQIAAARPHEQYVPPDCQVTLAMAGPRQGLVTWRVVPDWTQRVGEGRGDAWHGRRLVARLYDVTLIEFDGFNARRIEDLQLDRPTGERLFSLPTAGTVQLAEIGFVLPSGEFLPAARSRPTYFPSGGVALEHDPSALFVDAELRPEPVPTPWEAATWLRRRGAPELRVPLRLALCTMESTAVGDHGSSAAFAGELGRQLAHLGHEVHVLVPAKYTIGESRVIDGVNYHPVPLEGVTDPVEVGRRFAALSRQRLSELGTFDLCHLHEWMAAGLPRWDGVPTVLSLTSVEASRAGPGQWGEMSDRIQAAEREVARAADQVLVPDWLRERALHELGLKEDQVVPFPLEGRFLDEWEAPLDVGQVKKEHGLGPLDRLFLFVGPLEWGAGPDLLVEAMPALLSRTQNCRLVYVGLGGMQPSLEHRSHQLGVAHAVRWMGHLEGLPLVRLLRAAEAVVVPSRQREPFDEGVVLLARRAGRPVVTTHSGPSHLVCHEQNGLVTYDNPGSMVWAMNQILSDPQQSDMLGTLGRSSEDRRPQWADVAAHYVDLCAAWFPALRCPTEGTGRSTPSGAPAS